MTSGDFGSSSERTWAEDLVQYFRDLGGEAHYSDLYKHIEANPRRALGKEWQAVVRRTIEEHSSDTTVWPKRRLPDLFYSVDGETFFGVKEQIYSSLRCTDPDPPYNIEYPICSAGKIREDVFVLASYALYNLRSALDHIACAISMGKNRHKADFLICDDRTNFKRFGSKAVKDGKLCRKSLAFMESFKPYKRSNRTLWLLNRLNVIDKHKTLMVIDAQGFSVPTIGKPIVKRRVFKALDADKTNPTLIGKPKKDSQTAIIVAFLQIPLIRREHIETVLFEISAEVRDILEKARVAFPKASVPPL
jgi:hypothetical protein